MDPRHVPAPLGGYEGDCPDTKRVSTAFYKRGALPHSPRLFLTTARQIGCERATTIGNLNYSRRRALLCCYIGDFHLGSSHVLHPGGLAAVRQVFFIGGTAFRMLKVGSGAGFISESALQL